MSTIELVSLADASLDLTTKFGLFFFIEKGAERHGYKMRWHKTPALEDGLFHHVEGDVSRPAAGWFLERCGLVTDEEAADFVGCAAVGGRPQGPGLRPEARRSGPRRRLHHHLTDHHQDKLHQQRSRSLGEYP